MRRRTALRALAAGAATAATPGWIARAFAQSAPRGSSPAQTPSPPPLPSAELLRQARARGAAAGKPVLVLIVPSDPGQRFDRGHAFGELINHGGDERLALLALCEVVCGTDEAVRAVAGAALDARDPLMVLLETDEAPGAPPRAVPLEGALPAVLGRAFRGDFARQQREEDRIVEQRIEFLGALVRHAVAPDEAALERRAAQARARLAPAVAAQVDAALAAGTARRLPTGYADAAAAVLLAAAARAPGPAAREALVGAVAAAAVARLRNRRVAGGRWGIAGGCGSFIEGETDRGMMMCGMGHVAARSARFLDFYVAEGPRLR